MTPAMLDVLCGGDERNDLLSYPGAAQYMGLTIDQAYAIYRRTLFFLPKSAKNALEGGENGGYEANGMRDQYL
ncbi:hypothetical protein PA598K_01460 [Paenibacillus sp. 598K]|nr:hypothetical protein PA598K_01460 [Paenibacillus sp. 598K]